MDKLDKLIVMDSHSDEALDDMKFIFNSLNLKETALEQQNLLCSELIELKYVRNQFKSKMDDVLTNGTPSFNHYMPEINNVLASYNSHKIYRWELLVTELSVNFKSFIITVKSILDKVVPFFDMKHKSTLNKFSTSGNKLIHYLERNYTHENKDDFILFIQENKRDWIDFLISIRDKYVHFSDVSSYYLSFNCIVRRKAPQIKTINDINRPQVIKDSMYIDALLYIDDIYKKVVIFLRDFLLLSGYKVT